MFNLSVCSGVWKAAGASALGTILLLTLAYRLPTTLVVDMGDAVVGALLTDNFHDAEEGYRWTRGTSRMRFLDPGREVKILMRLPDGRNLATRQAVRCKLLTHWAFEYFDQTAGRQHLIAEAPTGNRSSSGRADE